MSQTIKKQSKLSYDGRQLITRIQKDIQEEAKLKKGDKLNWEAKGEKIKVRKDE